MKTDQLTESIGRSTGEARDRHDSAATSTTWSGTHDGEIVTITISTSTGYVDEETFSLREKRAANAFARTLMSLALRAFTRRNDDEE